MGILSSGGGRDCGQSCQSQRGSGTSPSELPEIEAGALTTSAGPRAAPGRGHRMGQSSSPVQKAAPGEDACGGLAGRCQQGTLRAAGSRRTSVAHRTLLYTAAFLYWVTP